MKKLIIYVIIILSSIFISSCEPLEGESFTLYYTEDKQLYIIYNGQRYFAFDNSNYYSEGDTYMVGYTYYFPFLNKLYISKNDVEKNVIENVSLGSFYIKEGYEIPTIYDDFIYEIKLLPNASIIDDSSLQYEPNINLDNKKFDDIFTIYDSFVYDDQTSDVSFYYAFDKYVEKFEFKDRFDDSFFHISFNLTPFLEYSFGKLYYKDEGSIQFYVADDETGLILQFKEEYNVLLLEAINSFLNYESTNK